MKRHLLRSVGAIVLACVVAFAVVAIAPIALLFIAERFPTDYRDLHPQVPFAITYALGGLVVGVFAGLAIGFLAPMRPVVHTLAAVIVCGALGIVVAGRALLPHGWEVAGLACLVALASAVAALTWRRPSREADIVAQAI